MNLNTFLNNLISYFKNKAAGKNYAKIEKENKVYEIEKYNETNLKLAVNIMFLQSRINLMREQLEQKYLSLKETEKKYKLHSSEHTKLVNQLHIINADLSILTEKKAILEREANQIYRIIALELQLQSKLS